MGKIKLLVSQFLWCYNRTQCPKSGWKGGDGMNDAQIMKNELDGFRDIQEYVLVAREENGQRAYAKMKKKYLY